MVDLPLPPVRESSVIRPLIPTTPVVSTRSAPPPAAPKALAPVSTPAPIATTTAAQAPTPARTQQAAIERPAAVERTRIDMELGAGQSLYDLFQRHDLHQGSLVVMVRQRDIKKALRRLRPGQKVKVVVNPNRTVHEMHVQRPGPTDLLIYRDEEQNFLMREVEDAPLSTAPASDIASTPSPEPATGSASVDAPTASEMVPTATLAAVSIFANDVRERQQIAESDVLRGDELILNTDPTALHRITVQPGDSLFRIFRRLGIPPQDLARLLDSDEQAKRLRRLRPGQELAFGLTHDRHMYSISMAIDEENTFHAHRADDGSYTVEVENHPLERRVNTASAVIENSLFIAGQRAGLSDRVIMALTEVFGWDIDFALDVRAGDRFTVVYEELYRDGEKVRDGPILASEFFNRGRSVRAIRFVDDTGRGSYFSPEGLSMRKAFLRTPVRFSRISSRFNLRRMHPVLKRVRAHRGVDYAAPTGTPIRATGDGRVSFAGRKGGYGRTVVIQHGATYSTLYAHMSRYHKRARTGRRVRQGDVIGYVGTSGLSTGPHLHYEFRVRGRHVDPLRVELPKAMPIEPRYKKAFLEASRPLVARLDTLARTSLAASR